MKKLLLCLLTVSAALGTTNSIDAARIKVDGIYYNTKTNPSGDQNGTCEVAQQIQGIDGDVVIPDHVTFNGSTYDVVAIGSHAFDPYDGEYDIDISSLTMGPNIVSIATSACVDQYCLTSVTFGTNVETIASSAFRNCALQEVEIPEKVTQIQANTFFENSSLRTVKLPEGLVSIGSKAFSGCSNLLLIDIPAGCTSIAFDQSAFAGCPKLTAINVAEGNTAYQSASGIVYNAEGTELVFCPQGLAAEHLTFPEGLTSIGDAAFRGVTSIRTIAFPENLTSIGNDAFNGCTQLTSIATPASLTTIGEYAFADCRSLTTVELNEGLETVGLSTFRKCNALTTIHLPSTIKSFGWSALYGCGGLQSITVEEGNEAYWSDGLALIDAAEANLLTFAAGATVKSYTVPDGVYAINSFAFQHTDNIETLNTNQVTEIGNDAIIGEKLADLTLGSRLYKLGNGAVELCPALTTIRLYSETTPQYAGIRDPFTSEIMTNATLYVPDQSVALYKQDMYWSHFANIKPMSEAPESDITTGLDGVTGQNEFIFDMAGRKASYQGAISMEAYDLYGRRIAKSSGEELDLSNTSGIVIVTATTPTTCVSRKVSLK